MSEQLRRLKPGERIEGIPGPTWNAFVDVVDYVRKLQQTLAVDPLRNVPQTGIVRFKNTSGQVRNRFDVLGITDVFPTPAANPNAFKSGPVLHGVTPDKEKHAGKFAILLEPAKPDAIVSACVAGVCVAKVNIEQDQEWMEFADVKDGDAGSLQADCHGSARILWKESGIGVKWAVVRLSNVPKQVYGAGTGAGKVPPGVKVPCVTPIHEQHIELADSGLKCPVAGMYAFGFQATLKRTKPPRNAIMRMQLFVDDLPSVWIGYPHFEGQRISVWNGLTGTIICLKKQGIDRSNSLAIDPDPKSLPNEVAETTAQGAVQLCRDGNRLLVVQTIAAIPDDERARTAPDEFSHPIWQPFSHRSWHVDELSVSNLVDVQIREDYV